MSILTSNVDSLKALSDRCRSGVLSGDISIREGSLLDFWV